MIKEARPETAVQGTPPRKRHWWRWILAGAAALVVLSSSQAERSSCASRPWPRWGCPRLPPAPPLARSTGRGASRRDRPPVSASGKVSSASATTPWAGRAPSPGPWSPPVIRSPARVPRRPHQHQGQRQAASPGRHEPRHPVLPGRHRHSGQAGDLGPALASGATISVMVTGRLAMRGVSRLVTFPVSGRRTKPRSAHRGDPGRLLRLGYHRANRIRLPRFARQPRNGRVPADPQPALTARWPRLAAVAEAGETVLSRSSCRVDASSTSFARAETHSLPR